MPQPGGEVSHIEVPTQQPKGKSLALITGPLFGLSEWVANILAAHRSVEAIQGIARTGLPYARNDSVGHSFYLPLPSGSRLGRFPLRSAEQEPASEFAVSFIADPLALFVARELTLYYDFKILLLRQPLLEIAKRLCDLHVRIHGFCLASELKQFSCFDEIGAVERVLQHPPLRLEQHIGAYVAIMSELMDMLSTEPGVLAINTSTVRQSPLPVFGSILEFFDLQLDSKFEHQVNAQTELDPAVEQRKQEEHAYAWPADREDGVRRALSRYFAGDF